LLGLDRVIDRATALIFQERLNYYIFYFRPIFHRKQFFYLIFLTILISIFITYLIFHTVHILSHIVIFLLLIVLIYGMIFLLTLFDSLVLKDIDRSFHFHLLEKDFIQIFSLGMFFPLIYVAYILKILLVIFRYPSQGIYVFKSFAGLTGFLFLSVGIIKLLL
jgi:hypothetical protein